MTEPKFTPKPWQRIGMKVCDAEGFTIAKCGWISQSDEEAMANGDLLAVAPELYENEEKNLEMLKTILKCYQDVGKLIMTDKDVQAAIQNETIKGIMMPEVIHLITEDLKTRIAETEALLAKARGEQE